MNAVAPLLTDTTPPAGYLSGGVPPRDTRTRTDWGAIEAYDIDLPVCSWKPLLPHCEAWEASSNEKFRSWYFSRTLTLATHSLGARHLYSAILSLKSTPKNLVYLHSIKHKSTEPEHIRFFLDDAHSDIKYELLLPWLLDQGKETDPLSGYEQYEQENWDGYGAKAISEATRTFARKLMKLLPDTLGKPDVSPAGDGTIALEWIPEDPAHKLDKLYLDIGPAEAWTAYWRLRNGTFDTIDHEGTSLSTRAMLQNLFTSLSK